ncbi:hypothetical protein EDL79_04720 [Ehrlichia ruminantium]|uniref:Uncharacterized protein n=1 Tax=Ehrlichia ruminantium TaxID=779 RepID=A0AAE6QAS4_EHRRU|nr:hypothetical protein [Ehrlichia ruminantium]QGR02905.1 hypothetical protein EDL81_04705 [Ehrlichia ruminantium]QGR03829.1 hypothetical protein EDL80_04710 [Ehrlichia ruminantium]QGR04756.1 hypothetical protein EDL79_04720 [Ehrlichia ruminantium]
MISAYFIINLAFCIGILLAFSPLRKKVRQLLSMRLNKVKREVTLPDNLQKQSKILSNKATLQSYEIEKAIHEILKKAHEEYDAIIAAHKADIEATLEKHLDVATKKISDQVSTMAQSLKLSTIDVATIAIQELIKESNEQNENQQDNNGVISTLDRDLRKKLH